TSYTIQEVTALQIQDITASTQVPQGHALYIAVQAFNNLNTTQSVDIYLNGKPWQIGVAIVPGANNIFLTLDPLNPLYPIVWNPYDLGSHNVNVTVIASGTTLVTQNFAIQSTVPIENVLLFYVLPVVIPIAAVLISYQRKKKREMLR
ncbi:MAG TPA: hypothetical protein VKK79_23005, partial [Candidatus Lokiarchaeia archaeon]|nr:hypothetical protein [Candidatus Lokiarchaeia archaeon]